MFARQWMAYAIAGLFAVAVVPTVSLAKSHVTAKPSIAAHRPTVRAAARRHIAKRPVKHAAKHATRKAGAKKHVHHKTRKHHRVRHQATVKKTTAVVVPPAPTARLF